ncbi:MAG: threonine ammonia-lyase [Burkholderiaceae bacterium]
MVDIGDIEAAAARIGRQVERTPFLHSTTLSGIVGADVYLKFENLQFTASFKERGALNKLLVMSPAARASGVLAISAGNHAQGVAYHARRLNVPATIVMPRFTPSVKVERTREFGAEVVLEGETFDEARAAGLALAESRGLSLVHPYDDPAVIAGQGTIGLEMLEVVPDLDAVVIAVGGGGLIAGVATALRARRPGIEIVGVQTERFPAAYDAFHGQHHPSAGSTIADGIAVEAPGAITVPIIRDLVDDMVLVTEADIEDAILMLLEVEKTVVEGAGAVGLAAALRHGPRWQGRKLGLLLCGGNIDPLLLASVIERGMVRLGRLTRLYVDMRDAPGALAEVTGLIADQNANIEEIRHQRAFTSVLARRVEVELVVQTRGRDHQQSLVSALGAAGYRARIG